MGGNTAMSDGLYAVVADRYGICAGLIVEGGRAVEAAPILRKRLAWWLQSPFLRKVA